jgi:hypothetical protein
MSVNTDQVAEGGVKNTPAVAGPHEIHSRTLLVGISQSPAGLDSLGAQAGTWTLEPKTAAAIFGVDESQPHEVTLEQLKHAIVHDITVEACNSSFQDTHALHVDGYTSSEFTQTGEPAHLFLLGPGI